MIKFFFIMAATAILFENCDSVDFNQQSSEILPINFELNGTQDEDFGLINKNCENGEQIKATIPVKFPKPKNTCEWEQNGNLSIKEARFRARIEQKVDLNLPVGAIICDAQFDFDPQPFKYDDYFALMLNNNIITAGYDFRSYLAEENFGLLNYDWDKIKNIPMGFGSVREQVFCPQVDGGVAKCDFPGHDTEGEINLELDKKYIRAVMSNFIPKNHSFTLVTFGDNNEWDCEHSDVEFDVTLTYVLEE